MGNALSLFLSRLSNNGCHYKSTSNGFQAQCPAHEDKKASLSISETNDRILIFCQAGCEAPQVLSALNLATKDLYNEPKQYKSGGDFGNVASKSSGQNKKKSQNASNGSPKEDKKYSKITNYYYYTDEFGKLLYRVCRKENKSFPVQLPSIDNPDPNTASHWVWPNKERPDLQQKLAVAKTLYKLPEIIAAIKEDKTIFLVEGEKDVDNLMSPDFQLVATCNPGGAGKWLDKYTDILAGAKKVVIIEDNDEPGKNHARLVAGKLSGKVENIYILSIPNLKEKGDFSDYKESGATLEDFKKMCEENVRKFDADDSINIQTETVSLPEIYTDIQPSAQTEQSINALLARNMHNNLPRLFLKNGLINRIVVDPIFGIKTEVCSEDVIFDLLTQSAIWMRHIKDGEKPSKPSRDIAKAIIATPDQRFPIVNAILQSPALVANKLIIEPGYDAEVKVIYLPHSDFTLPQTSDNPTYLEMRSAVKFLLDEVFGDFMFSHNDYDRLDWQELNTDRANYIGGLLTPFIKYAFKGKIPMLLLDAPAPGSGKTKLAGLIGLIATGKDPLIKNFPSEESEQRKTITSSLASSIEFLIFDNMTGTLKSEALAICLTSPVWLDRLLGFSRDIALANNLMLVATSNNLLLTEDFPRRIYKSRLDTGKEHPDQIDCNQFRHPDIESWCMENRGNIIAAILVLIKYWINQGKPLRKQLMGSFENWSANIGGLLECCGIGGFLDTQLENFDLYNVQNEPWLDFVDCWFDTYQHQTVSSETLNSLCSQHNLMAVIRGEKKSSEVMRLGRSLMKNRGKIFNGFKIDTQAMANEKGQRGRNGFKLTKIEPPKPKDNNSNTPNNPENDPNSPKSPNEKPSNSNHFNTYTASIDPVQHCTTSIEKNKSFIINNCTTCTPCTTSFLSSHKRNNISDNIEHSNTCFLYIKKDKKAVHAVHPVQTVQTKDLKNTMDVVQCCTDVVQAVRNDEQSQQQAKENTTMNEIKPKLNFTAASTLAKAWLLNNDKSTPFNQLPFKITLADGRSLVNVKGNVKMGLWEAENEPGVEKREKAKKELVAAVEIIEQYWIDFGA